MEIWHLSKRAQRTHANEMRSEINSIWSGSGAHGHYLHTVPEILQQANGQIDAFLILLAQAVRLEGVPPRSRNVMPFCVISLNLPTLLYWQAIPVYQSKSPHSGGGYSMLTALINKDQIDGYLQVTDEEAMEATRRLVQKKREFSQASHQAQT